MRTTDRSQDWRIAPFTVVSEGIAIRGRFFFPPSRPAGNYPALVICHGVPGSVPDPSEEDPGYEGLAKEFASLGMVAGIFNFRGCGDSEGDFEILGWARDLGKVLEETRNNPEIDPDRVMVLGFSGGGAAALYAAADNPAIHSLAVVGTPANFRIFQRDPEEIIRDFRARGLFRDSGFPPDANSWIRGFEEIEPHRWIARFKGKSLLVVHGDADELIPLEHARELFARAPSGTAELLVIPGGVHRLRLDPRCVEKLKEWFVTSLGRA